MCVCVCVCVCIKEMFRLAFPDIVEIVIRKVEKMNELINFRKTVFLLQQSGFPRVRGLLENVRQFIPRLRFFFSLKVENGLRTLIPLFRPRSVHSGSAS